MFTSRFVLGLGVLAAGAALLGSAAPTQAQRTVPFTVTVNAQELFRQLELDKVQVHFHETGSFVRVPTKQSGQFRNMPADDQGSWSKKFGPWKYAVNDINSQSVRLESLQAGLVVVAVDFETNGSELRGTMSGILPNKGAPDVQAKSLRVLIKMPFNFKTESQTVELGNPTLNVQAQWQLSVKGLPAKLRDAILRDRWINKLIERIGNKALAKMRPDMEQKLNNALQKRLRGGRIESWTVQNGNIVIQATTGNQSLRQTSDSGATPRSQRNQF